MGARFRSWWQQIKKHRVAIGVVAMVLVVAITLIIAGYWFDWTGFNGYNKITVAHTISGTNAGTVTKTEEYQPGRTLWDWLQLLIIPAVLAVGGYLFNYSTSRNERNAADRHNQAEREIAQDNQREAALQEYIDKISELLLHEKLRESQPEDEVRTIARVRTLTTLPRLDQMRKMSMLQFLHESKLIEIGKSIISLSGANLSAAVLSAANLSYSNLSDANLSGADLSKTDLSRANLSEANLRGANLRGANLSKTDLSGHDLSYTALSEANLSEANLSGANLSGANLGGADISWASLRGANLSGTCRMDATFLSDANLSLADLTEANLSFASLDRADLRGAHLSGANLSDADLRGANLSDADLCQANITSLQLDEAQSLKGATMPDGSIHP